MNLFETQKPTNLLPRDGEANYLGPVMEWAEAERYFAILRQSIPWENDEVLMFGRRLVMGRKMAWFGEAAYTYSGSRKLPLPWTPDLLALKQLVEIRSEETYNSCLLNFYEDGSQGMGWHADDERSLAVNAAIGSLSLGAERKFRFKHRESGEAISLQLENGSLLLMKGTCQAHWLHSLPKSKRVQLPRINLTFRTMVNRPL